MKTQSLNIFQALSLTVNIEKKSWKEKWMHTDIFVKEIFAHLFGWV